MIIRWNDEHGWIQLFLLCVQTICSVEECSIEEIEHGHKVYLAGTASPKKCGNAMKINEVSTPQTDAAGPNRMKSGSGKAGVNRWFGV